MGQYRFAIPDSQRFHENSLVAAQIIGLEGIPWPGKTILQDRTLVVSRNTNLSGRLLIPFETAQHGELAICTGTLPEKETEYLLDVELARGCLSRLRNQVSIWREGGLKISPDFDTGLDDLVEKFASAVFMQDVSERVQLCEQVMDESVNLMFEITNEFSRQIAAIHSTQPKNVPVIAGSVFDGHSTRAVKQRLTDLSIQRMAQPVRAEPVDDAGEFDFSATNGVIDWLSEPTASSVRIVGPLLQFDNMSLPGWMPEEASFEERLDAAKSVCRRLGAEYQRRIKILHVTSGLSGVGHQHFNYPQQLQMTLEMLETLDQAMPNTSMMVSFDQPWGERLSMATGGVQAMEIADALLRYGARISAFGLEFNLDYWPQGTLMRDPLQWVDLIDRWSQFGLPLAIYLTAPTGDIRSASGGRFAKTIRGSTDGGHHLQYLTTVFNFLIRRPSVNVVAWRRSMDQDNHRFPLSGLLNEQGDQKEVMQWFGRLVQEVADERAVPKDGTPTH